MYYKKYNEDNKIVKSREPYGPIEEQYMNVELHIIRAHHYMSMLYVLTCNAAERQRPEHFLPLSVGFFLGSRSRIPFRLLSDLDVRPRYVVALGAAGGRHRRRRLHPPRDHQGAVLHQVRV